MVESLSKASPFSQGLKTLDLSGVSGRLGLGASLGRVRGLASSESQPPLLLRVCYLLLVGAGYWVIMVVVVVMMVVLVIARGEAVVVDRLWYFT